MTSKIRKLEFKNKSLIGIDFKYGNIHYGAEHYCSLSIDFVKHNFESCLI